MDTSEATDMLEETPEKAPANTGYLLNRENLALIALASTDETRGPLTGLYCDAKGTVATNGHALGMVSLPDASLADMPDRIGVSPDSPTPATVPCTLSAAVVKSLQKALPKQRRHPILGHVVVERLDKGARCTTTDGETTTPVTGPTLEETHGGAFPEYSQVMPSKKPTLSIGFDATLLSNVLAVVAEIVKHPHVKGPGRLAAFARFDFWTANDPLRIVGKTAAGQSFTFLVMPSRL